jgi:LPS-assembly protein
MTHHKHKLLIIFGFANYCSYAFGDVWSFLGQNNLRESQPLVCGIEDDSWVEKSGPDYVMYPNVESETLFLSADTINGQNKGNQIAQGNVIGYKGNQTFSADWLIYNQPTGRVTTGDNMVLTRQYDVITGQQADYYLDLYKGTFTKANIYFESANLSGAGESITLYDKNHLGISNGYFTGCDPNDPAWYIKSQNITVDYQDASGTARNATMYFESVPIFASPYMSFPLGQRKSGWLTPQFGGTSTSGFMASDSYYWDMAPNYDMTITPYIWAQQGFMVSDQFRYMTESNVGSIYTEQVPYNWGTTVPNSYRYYWSLNDTYSPYSQVQMGYKYNVVSDSNYFNDFGNFYSVTDNVNLEQSVFANYNPTWGNAGVKLLNYQTLQPYGYASTVPIYSSYPAVNFNVKPQDIGDGFKGGLTSNYTYFYSPAMQSGQRLYLYPSVTYPMQTTWGYSTPKIGYNYTYYDLGETPNISGTAMQVQRALPVVSLDNGLYFDRPMQLGGGGNFTQTLEPRLYYLYIPQNNQSEIPTFDTATATYNYNQLFSENRFSGFDRINSANDVTIGGTTRILNDANGFELMNFSAGYRYYITEQNNFLYGNQTQYAQLFLPNPNLIAELNNNWTRKFSTSATFQYSTVYNTIDAYSAGFKYNPEDYKVINARFRYQYQLPLFFYGWMPGQALTSNGATFENQYALDVSGQWPIYDNKLFAVGRSNYDFTMGQFLNLVGGVEYNGGCWTVSAVYEQFTFNVNQTQIGYFLQFSLKGIGGVGTGDPTSDLKTNVPGYMPISQQQFTGF